MVVRRPLVLSGQFLSEADDNDGKVILGSITYGSGLGEESENYDDNYTVNTYVASQASGLILVLEDSKYKLGDDGFAQVLAQSALASGNLALAQVAPAYASGVEAQRIAVEALSSGNAALLANLSGIQLSSAAIQLSPTAISSGQAAITASVPALANALNATVSGTYASISGNSALSESVKALASGNAALYVLANNPFVDQNTVIGLIMGLG